MVAREAALDRANPIVRFVRRAVPFFILASITGCGQMDASGTYIAKDKDGVYFLHMVETPDKRITGELDTAVLQSSGRIQYQNMAVTGAADGGTVSLSIKPVAFLPVTVPISGTLESDKLTLIGAVGGGQPGVTIFARANPDDYRSQLNALGAQSREILAANAVAAANTSAARQEQEFVATANQLVARMAHFNSAAEGGIAGLPAFRERMRAITARMDSYLVRERQLAGDSNAAVVRGQISVAVSQGMIATDELLGQVRSLEGQYQANAEPLMQSAIATSEGCHWAELPNPKSGPETSACQEVLGAMPTFKRNFEDLRSALQAWEAAYSDTHDAQQKLVDASQTIE